MPPCGPRPEPRRRAPDLNQLQPVSRPSPSGKSRRRPRRLPMRPIKLKPPALALSLTCATPVLAHVVPSTVPNMILDHDVPVTMNNGLLLRVNIYRPKTPGHYPVLMLMGPYGKDTTSAMYCPTRPPGPSSPPNVRSRASDRRAATSASTRRFRALRLYRQPRRCARGWGTHRHARADSR